MDDKHAYKHPHNTHMLNQNLNFVISESFKCMPVLGLSVWTLGLEWIKQTQQWVY